MASTLAPVETAATQRPLRIRVRADLICSPQRYQGGDYWLVKDPLTLQYFRFQEEEYWLLQALNGQVSAESLQEEFQRRFAPQKLLVGEIHQFAGMLFRSGLVIADSSEQGRQLWQRREKQLRTERWGQCLNLLSYRFPGIDPGRLLDRLAPWTNWCFTRPAAGMAVALILAAVVLALTQFEQLQQRLPSFEQFFSVQNWMLLALTLAVTKVIHELGHGLACKRLGGQCHEMGVMLLVLTPCLYCNVSDAWMIPSKWKRIFVSAAGMYVELVMAAIAVFVWWFSQPGWVNSMALNLIFVCGVSTVLFNLNPLLRFDGYYILADWLEIPNLRQKATKLFQQTASQCLLGLPVPRDPFLPQRHVAWFVLYSVAAVVYRWVLTFTIFWFLYHLLEPYGLKLISQLLAAFSLLGLVVYPSLQLIRFFKTPGRIEAVKPLRVTMTASVAAAVLAGVMLLPLPHYVDMPMYVQPANMTNVYVDVPGVLDEVLVKKYQQVRAGQPLVRLVNHDLQKQHLAAQHDVEKNQRKYEELSQRLAAGDQHASLALDTIDAQIRNSHLILTDVEKRIQSLQISAPVDGWLLPAPTADGSEPDADRLPGLIGDPLEQRNRTSLLREQTMIAQVAPDRTKWEAMILVDQEDVEFTSVGQDVKIWLAQFPNQVFRTKVEEVAVDPQRFLPTQMASLRGGPIEATTTHSGQFKSVEPQYLVVAALENPNNLLVKDLTGVARIHVGYRTLGYRLTRFFAHTFNFKL